MGKEKMKISHRKEVNIMFFKKNKKAPMSKQEALLKELLKEQKNIPSRNISYKDIQKLENNLAELKARL